MSGSRAYQIESRAGAGLQTGARLNPMKSPAGAGLYIAV
jgi:hypothetical protein